MKSTLSDLLSSTDSANVVVVDTLGNRRWGVSASALLETYPVSRNTVQAGLERYYANGIAIIKNQYIVIDMEKIFPDWQRKPDKSDNGTSVA